jgi:hypothetical protein
MVPEEPCNRPRDPFTQSYRRHESEQTAYAIDIEASPRLTVWPGAEEPSLQTVMCMAPVAFALTHLRISAGIACEVATRLVSCDLRDQ